MMTTMMRITAEIEYCRDMKYGNLIDDDELILMMHSDEVKPSKH
jgi:hypothetical protein